MGLNENEFAIAGLECHARGSLGYSFTLVFVLSYLTSTRPTCETISDGIFGIKIKAAMSD